MRGLQNIGQCREFNTFVITFSLLPKILKGQKFFKKSSLVLRPWQAVGTYKNKEEIRKNTLFLRQKVKLVDIR